MGEGPAIKEEQQILAGAQEVLTNAKDLLLVPRVLVPRACGGPTSCKSDRRHSAYSCRHYEDRAPLSFSGPTTPRPSTGGEAASLSAARGREAGPGQASGGRESYDGDKPQQELVV